VLLPEDLNGRRIYRDTTTGRTAESVTARARAVVGDTFAYDPISALEGEGAHMAALNWLAYRQGWLSTFALPGAPQAHPDPHRWGYVMASALQGAVEWFTRREVVPLLSEEPSVNWRYGIAGCPDLKALVTWHQRRVVALVELKFTAALLMAHRLQLRLYRRLEGYEDARMGFLVRISRDDGKVEECPVFWDEHPEQDAKALGGKHV
jgi:hypothetical protein